MCRSYSSIKLWGLRALLAGTAAMAFAAPAYSHPEPAPGFQRDSDRDGLSDAMERRTGTDPLRRDTDSDGVPDGLEDRNQDGIVGPHESDPRRAGLFPGGAPHIPEPLHFDMVRALGARRGELEVNTLALVSLRDGEVRWAPEVEWAFADGHAIEFEVPAVDRHVEALKGALQGTLPSPWECWTHGWQIFGEYELDDRTTDAVALYLFGQRFARQWSYLAMAGARGTATRLPQTLAALANLSLFFDAWEWLTIGVESNIATRFAARPEILVLPQVSWQITERLRLQTGAGIEFLDDTRSPVAALRVILE